MALGQNKVLIVDDEASARFLLAVAFQRAGFDTDVAESGRDAIALLKRSRQYCCVLLDLNIPPPDGIAVAEFIRDSVPDLPVIVVSGYSDLAERMKNANLGSVVRLVVMKPIEASTIVNHVHAGGLCIRERRATNGTDVPGRIKPDVEQR